jgi:hypothetical protein
MAGVDDQAAVARWLYSRLSGDGAVAALVGTRIYPETAPQDENGDPDTVFPFVSFSFNRGRVLQVSGGRQRALSNQYVAVQATDGGEDYDRVTAVMQAVDASLTADSAEGSVSVGGVSHYVSVVGQQQPFRLPEFSRGQHYRTAGRIYRLMVWTG